jgi:hypothetical protein
MYLPLELGSAFFARPNPWFCLYCHCSSANASQLLVLADKVEYVADRPQTAPESGPGRGGPLTSHPLVTVFEEAPPATPTPTANYMAPAQSTFHTVAHMGPSSTVAHMPANTTSPAPRGLTASGQPRKKPGPKPKPKDPNVPEPEKKNEKASKVCRTKRSKCSPCAEEEN